MRNAGQVADVLQKIEFIGQVNTSGTTGVDILIGDRGNNDLRGWSGDDYVYGGDIVYGREGKDVLLGGDGNDFMRGHQGDDILIGGDGADMFAFLRYSGASGQFVDRIMDFNASQGDKILLATNHYGISDLTQVTFDSQTNQLSVKGNVIAVLENQSGFAVNNTNIELGEIWW
ncbi:MAG: calcium-binding protein [Cyanobacteria bacterium P01_H01_bin.35]